MTIVNPWPSCPSKGKLEYETGELKKLIANGLRIRFEMLLETGAPPVWPRPLPRPACALDHGAGLDSIPPGPNPTLPQAHMGPADHSMELDSFSWPASWKGRSAWCVHLATTRISA